MEAKEDDKKNAVSRKKCRLSLFYLCLFILHEKDPLECGEANLLPLISYLTELGGFKYFVFQTGTLLLLVYKHCHTAM